MDFSWTARFSESVRFSPGADVVACGRFDTINKGEYLTWSRAWQQAIDWLLCRSFPLMGQLIAKVLVLLLQFQHHSDAGEIQSLGE